MGIPQAGTTKFSTLFLTLSLSLPLPLPLSPSLSTLFKFCTFALHARFSLFSLLHFLIAREHFRRRHRRRRRRRRRRVAHKFFLLSLLFRARPHDNPGHFHCAPSLGHLKRFSLTKKSLFLLPQPRALAGIKLNVDSVILYLRAEQK